MTRVHARRRSRLSRNADWIFSPSIWFSQFLIPAPLHPFLSFPLTRHASDGSYACSFSSRDFAARIQNCSVWFCFSVSSRALRSCDTRGEWSRGSRGAVDRDWFRRRPDGRSLPRGPERTFSPEVPGSAQLARRHRVPPCGMMVVAVMTPRAVLALRCAAIIGVRHVFAALHLIHDRVTERPWTAFPVAPDLAVLKEAEGAAPLSSPFYAFVARNSRGTPAVARKRIDDPASRRSSLILFTQPF